MRVYTPRKNRYANKTLTFLSVALEEGDKPRLQELAKKRGITLSELVRTLVRDLLKDA